TWSFGDGTPGSTDPNPRHLYATPGAFDAILTVSNDAGDVARDTVRLVIIAGTGFPLTAAIDDFERPDGPLATPWAGNLSGLAVRQGDLIQNVASSYATWNGQVFGANQEVWERFDAVDTTATEHDLLLASQGTSWTAGAIDVVY